MRSSAGAAGGYRTAPYGSGATGGGYQVSNGIFRLVGCIHLYSPRDFFMDFQVFELTELTRGCSFSGWRQRWRRRRLPRRNGVNDAARSKF